VYKLFAVILKLPPNGAADEPNPHPQQNNTRLNLDGGRVCAKIPGTRTPDRPGQRLGLATVARRFLLRCGHSILRLCTEVKTSHRPRRNPPNIKPSQPLLAHKRKAPAFEPGPLFLPVIEFQLAKLQKVAIPYSSGRSFLPFTAS
jgi:hypothetical protein